MERLPVLLRISNKLAFVPTLLLSHKVKESERKNSNLEYYKKSHVTQLTLAFVNTPVG